MRIATDLWAGAVLTLSPRSIHPWRKGNSSRRPARAETAVKPLAVASILPLTEYGIIWSLLDVPPDPISYAAGGANQTNKESHFKGGYES
jgi:hypothetical protein